MRSTNVIEVVGAQVDVIIIIILYITRFARGTRKAGSDLYRDDVVNMQIAEIRRDKGMSATLD